MSSRSEENKAIVRRFLEAGDKGDLETLDELMAPDFVDHSLLPGQGSDHEGYKQAVTAYHTALSDLHLIIHDQVAEGDEVVTRWTARGTHQGEFFGVAPTGNHIEMSGIQIDRFDESGKMVEEWPEYDLLGAMRQMGAVSEPRQGYPRSLFSM